MCPPPEPSGGSEKPPPSAPDPQKAWRESFNAYERAVGQPLEAFLQSDEFADAAAAFIKSQSEARELFEKNTQAWMKAWNMPTLDDQEALGKRVEEVVGRVERLERRLDRLESRSAERPRSGAQPPPHAGTSPDAVVRGPGSAQLPEEPGAEKTLQASAETAPDPSRGPGTAQLPE